MKFLYPFIALLFIGCGDAVDTTSERPSTIQQSAAIDMVINQPYSVNKGDYVGNQSTDAQVKIIKDVEGEATSVTLIQGSAQLIRAN